MLQRISLSIARPQRECDLRTLPVWPVSPEAAHLLWCGLALLGLDFHVEVWDKLNQLIVTVLSIPEVLSLLELNLIIYQMMVVEIEKGEEVGRTEK